jgi:hypothetical protein
MCCTEGQGYLFARPLSAEDIVAWITSHRKSRVITDLFDRAIPDFLLQAPAQG